MADALNWNGCIIWVLNYSVDASEVTDTAMIPPVTGEIEDDVALLTLRDLACRSSYLHKTSLDFHSRSSTIGKDDCLGTFVHQESPNPRCV
jgi:hypothetical protein